MPLDKIYRHQRVPFPALVLVVTRVRSSTLAHLFPDLNSISLFGTILHAPPPKSFAEILAVNVADITLTKQADTLSHRFYEHIRTVRNNDVDNPVARHFNTANHSICDIIVCDISPISFSNDSLKRQEIVSFLKLEPFIPTCSTNDFLSFDLFIVSVSVQHMLTNGMTSHLYSQLLMFIHLPLIHFAHPPRLLIHLKNSE